MRFIKKQLSLWRIVLIIGVVSNRNTDRGPC